MRIWVFFWRSCILILLATNLYADEKCFHEILRGKIVVDSSFKLQVRADNYNYYCQGRSTRSSTEFMFKKNIVFSNAIRALTFWGLRQSLSFISLEGDIHVRHKIEVGGDSMDDIKKYSRDYGKYVGGFHTDNRNKWFKGNV